VGITLWKVAGSKAAAICAAAGEGAVYIADGHHRFETAGAYREKNPQADRVIALVVPLEDPGLVVLPTYRLLRQPALKESVVTAQLGSTFEVQPVDSEMEAVSLLADLGRDATAALVALPGGKILSLVLRNGAD